MWSRGKWTALIVPSAKILGKISSIPAKSSSVSEEIQNVFSLPDLCNIISKRDKRPKENGLSYST